MSIIRLRKKSQNNTLEVEHILAAAKARVPGLREELDRLSDEFEWSNSNHLADGSHVVPLAKWAEIAGAYAEGGINSLTLLAREPKNSGYIIGLLEELGSLEAVDALVEFFIEIMHNPQDFPETAWRLASAYNQLLSFKKSSLPEISQADIIRSFLDALLPIAKTDAQRACIICALRGVGNEISIKYLLSIDNLPYPYEKVRKASIRSIRQRMLA